MNTEKKLWKLKIDEEFKSLIPPLLADERKMLEASLLADGCMTPVMIWNGVIVDGHNRYDICHRNQIPFTVQEKEFSDREDAMRWMLSNQLGRRNLNDYQRGEMVLKLKPMLAAAAHKRKQHRNEEQNDTVNVAELPTNLSEAPQPPSQKETMAKLGKIAGVSGTNMRKIKKLSETADEQTKNELRSGKLSVSKAYDDQLKKERAATTRECVRCHEIKSLNDFPISKYSHVFSHVCKDCAQKQKETEARGENATYVTPIGMEQRDGAPVHVTTEEEDKPENFDVVIGLIEFATRAYLDNFRVAIKRFMPTMRSEANLDSLKQLINNTAATAHTMLNNRMMEEQ